MRPTLRAVVVFLALSMASMASAGSIKPSLREIGGKLHGQRKEGGHPRTEKGMLLFDGSMDGNRQVDPQIAVGGGYVFHGTNHGFIIYDKEGSFVDGVATADSTTASIRSCSTA